MVSVEFDCRVVGDVRVIADYGLEQILSVRVGISRISSVMDYVDLNYSNSLELDLHEGMYLHVRGDLRSLMDTDGLMNYVHSEDITVLEGKPWEFQNSVFGTCVLKRKPVYRTKLDDPDVQITELDVKAVRIYQRVSHIRCTAWKRLAKLSRNLEPGLELEIEGRLQSHVNKSGRLLIEVSLYSIKILDSGDTLCSKAKVD